MADTVITSDVVRSDDSPQGERLVGFLGRWASLLGIILVNSLLSIVTLGVYRFWARTRLRQFFWNSIDVDGDPLEYTGRGLELFVGFLIAVAVLVPLSIGYSILSIFLQTTAPDVSDAVNFLYFIALLWLGQYAYFRARRYRLVRTVWRGIRAGQDGSAAGYAWLWFGYAVLSVITLGWAVPWMTAELQKYEVEHARFGVENFRYEGSGSELFRAWVPCIVMWTLGTAITVVTTVVNLDELQRLYQIAADVSEGSDIQGHAANLQASLRSLSIYGTAVLAYLFSIPFYISYRIKAFRYMFSVSNLSEVSFAAEFGGWRLVAYWVLYFVVSISLVVIVVSLFSALGALAAVTGSGELASPGLGGASVLLSVVPIILLLFFFPMTNLLFFYFPAIRHVVMTLKLTEISSLDRIVQSSKDDPRFGEGLAAALDFDVGGF